MTDYIAGRVRTYLLERGTGATVVAMGEELGINSDSIRKALKTMPDAYIDRWVWSNKWIGKWVAVWDVIEVPEDCPKPTTNRESEEMC